MKRPRLGSILLASGDPERLHAWYVAALEPEADEEMDQYRILTFDGFHLMIDTRDDISAANPEPGRLILNFEVADAEEVVSRLDQMGTRWVAPLEDRDGSLFATALDPDGNYVQVIEIGEAHRAAMEQGQEDMVIDPTKAFGSFAVRDVDDAATFYGRTLGMKVAVENGMLFLHLTEDHVILLYPKPDHVPASYTVLNFPVGDVDAAVEQLRRRGVEFRRYEGFEQDDRDIARADGGPPIAWFTDPSGNVLSVVESG